MKQVSANAQEKGMNSFGTVVRERREALGIKQEELSTGVGYRSRSTIANIENGTQIPSWYKALAIADYLKLPLDAFRQPELVNSCNRSILIIEVKTVQRVVKQLKEVVDDLSATLDNA